MSTKTIYDYSYPTGLAPLPEMDVADWLRFDTDDEPAGQGIGHYIAPQRPQEQVRHIHHSRGA